VIAFDTSKGESHHPGSNYKKFSRQLRERYKVTLNTENLTIEKLQEYDVLIIGNPSDTFGEEEFDAMRQHLQEGRSIAFFSSEGGEEDNVSNLNSFLEEYGIRCESDAVVRTTYHKYLHPKHVYLSNSALHQTILSQNMKHGNDIVNTLSSKDESNNGPNDEYESDLALVYPNGCTIDIQTPSLAILSSGTVSFPANRPIGGVWEDNRPPLPSSKIRASSGGPQGGRLLVVGSSDIFADDWLEKEDNGHLLNILVRFLVHDESVSFDRSKVIRGSDVDEAKTVPDVEALSERLRCCLQESEPLPQDLGSMFRRDMLSFDTSLIPTVIDQYKLLGIKHEPLSLIPPNFERPLPPLQPAVFAPKLRDLPPPALDQFDLDDEFANPISRLAQLTNKCSDDDLEFYAQEAGTIVGLVEPTETEVDGKRLLHDLFQKVCRSKQLYEQHD